MAYKSKYTGLQIDDILDSVGSKQTQIEDLESIRAGAQKGATALQSYTEKYTGTVTGVKINGTTKNPSSGVVDLGTVITAHQDISGKQDKLVSGTNIKTVNGQSLLGEGNIEIGGKEYVKKELNGTYGMTFGASYGKLEPNKVYYSDTYLKDGFSILEVAEPATDVGEYAVVFSFSANIPSVYVECPSNWLWANGQIPETEGGVSYELSVVATKVDGSFIYKAVLTPFKSV